MPLQKYYIISFHSNDAAITKKCAFQRNDGLSHAHDKTKIIFLQLPCSIRKMLPSFQFLGQFNFHSFFIVFLIFDSPSESHILELFIDYVEVNIDGHFFQLHKVEYK